MASSDGCSTNVAMPRLCSRKKRPWYYFPSPLLSYDIHARPWTTNQICKQPQITVQADFPPPTPYRANSHLPRRSKVTPSEPCSSGVPTREKIWIEPSLTGARWLDRWSSRPDSNGFLVRSCQVCVGQASSTIGHLSFFCYPTKQTSLLRIRVYSSHLAVSLLRRLTSRVSAHLGDQPARLTSTSVKIPSSGHLILHRIGHRLTGSLGNSRSFVVSIIIIEAHIFQVLSIAILQLALYTRSGEGGHQALHSSRVTEPCRSSASSLCAPATLF